VERFQGTEEGGYGAARTVTGRSVSNLDRDEVTTAADEANHLMTNLNFPDAAGQDIRGAVQHLKQSSKKVAVGGFCMGGAPTILAAVRYMWWTPAPASMAFRPSTPPIW
jgi:dienelactone hydrolase